MNTMPKDTTLTPLQKTSIAERAQRIQSMRDMAAQETENLMGRIPRNTDVAPNARVPSSTQKRVATGMKGMMTQLGRVVKQEEATAVRQQAARDAANDSMLSTLAEKQLSIKTPTPKGSSRRKRKSRGGRKRRSTRRKV